MIYINCILLPVSTCIYNWGYMLHHMHDHMFIRIINACMVSSLMVQLLIITGKKVKENCGKISILKKKYWCYWRINTKKYCDTIKTLHMGQLIATHKLRKTMGQPRCNYTNSIANVCSCTITSCFAKQY